MTSFRQIDANRLNALKSTGPKTEVGKQHPDAMQSAMDLQPIRGSACRVLGERERVYFR
jgi:hypothetical protein